MIPLTPSHKNASSRSNRIMATPSQYAKEHYLYVQEVGSLESIEPHVSSRSNLSSFLFFIVISGSGYFFYDNIRKPLRAGDCVWIDCQTPYSHESSKEDPWSLTWVHFYGSHSREFYNLFLQHGHSFVFRPISIEPFVEGISTLYHTHKNQTSLTELISNKYLTDIITFCFTESGSSHFAEEKTSQHSTIAKLMQIREYIDSHFADSISLDELSQHFFISKFHLSREYVKMFGITIGNDITLKRISKAKSLLRFTTKSIDAIGEECGFQNSGYFIKVFKRTEAMTPLEFRKKW